MGDCIQRAKFGDVRYVEKQVNVERTPPNPRVIKNGGWTLTRRWVLTRDNTVNTRTYLTVLSK